MNVLVELDPIFHSVNSARYLLTFVGLQNGVETYGLHIVKALVSELFDLRLLRVVPALVTRTRLHHRSDTSFYRRGLHVRSGIVIFYRAKFVNVHLSLSDGWV